MKGYATEEKQEDKDAAWTHGGISLLGESLTMGCVQCFFVTVRAGTAYRKI